MSQFVDMGPQPEMNNIPGPAMKVDFSHKCYSVEEGEEPVRRELTVYYPINDGVWLPIYPQCAICACQLHIDKREVVQ